MEKERRCKQAEATVEAEEKCHCEKVEAEEKRHDTAEEAKIEVEAKR